MLYITLNTYLFIEFGMGFYYNAVCPNGHKIKTEKTKDIQCSKCGERFDIDNDNKDLIASNVLTKIFESEICHCGKPKEKNQITCSKCHAEIRSEKL